MLRQRRCRAETNRPSDVKRFGVLSWKVLILQLEGRKHWRLYAPPEPLPRDYSRDLSQEAIGEPTHDFILEVSGVHSL